MRSFKPLLKLLLAALAFAVPVAATAQTNQLSFTDTEEIPAGTPGLTITVHGNIPGSPQSPFCFYTGYGSTAVITPADNGGDPTFATLTVPASTIQDIPSSVYASNSGEVTGLLYAAPLGSTCDGTFDPAYTSSIPLNLFTPSLFNVNLTSLPAPNPNLTTNPAPPKVINLQGAEFVPGQTSVIFSGSGFPSITVPGTVVSEFSTQVNVPSNLPVGATSVNIDVCTTVPSDMYCTTPSGVSLPFTPLVTNPGSVTATPNPTTPSTPVTLTATFGNAAAGVGIPSGTVSFTDNGTAIGLPAPLVFTTGQFVGAPKSSLEIENGQPLSTALVDLNKDGLQDIVMFVGNRVHILSAINNLGGYTEIGFEPDPSNCSNLTGVTAADFNGDGYPDIAILCDQGGSSNILIYLNQGDGTISGTESNTISVPESSLIVAADFNKDHNADIVLTGLDGSVTTLLGNGTGKFAPPSTNPAGLASPVQIQAVDLNNDGAPDLIILNNNGGPTPVWIYQNDGSGNFGSAPVYIQSFGDGLSTSQIYPRFLPGSPYPDLVAINHGASGSIDLVFNNQTSAIGFSNTHYPTSVPNLLSGALADVNGDGYPDVVVYDGTNLSAYDSDHSGAYQNPLAGFTTPATDLFVFGSSDPNADGYADPLVMGPVVNPGFGFVQQYITSGTATATLTGQTFAAGSHAIAATTPGNFNFNNGSANTTLVSNATTPLLTIIMSPASPTTYAGTGSQTFDADVLASSAPAPTGTIQFFDNGTLIDTLPLTGISASESFASTFPSLSAGTHSLSFVYSGDGNYAGGISPTKTYVVNPATPTVTWTPNPATITYGTPLVAAQLNATATQGSLTANGTFAYSSTSGPIAAGTILPAGTDNLSVAFTSSDPNYANTTGSTTITVNKATPVVTWTPTTSTITFGTGLSNTQLNATAKVGTTTVAGTFTYRNSSSTIVTTGTVLPVGADALTVTFVPTDTADYATPTATVGTTITVNKASSSIALTVNPVSPTNYTPTGTETITGTITVPGPPLATGTIQFFDGATLLGTQVTSSSVAPLTVGPLAAGTHSLTVVYSGDVNYFGSTSPITSYVVNKTTPVVTWTPTEPTITFGTGLDAGQLNATAKVGGTAVAGTFTYATSSGTVTTGSVLPAGSNVLTVTFVPTDTTDFNTPIAAVSATITVNKAESATTLSISPVSPTTYALNRTETLTATVTVPASDATGSVQFFDNSNPMDTLTLGAGTGGVTTVSLIVGPLLAGTHVLTATYSGDSNYIGSPSTPFSYVVNQGTPSLTWNTPANIITGTPLSGTQLNATATSNGSSVEGSFAYTPAAGTVLSTGPHTLSVTFTPMDTLDFTTATTTVNITVTAASSPAPDTAVGSTSPTQTASVSFTTGGVLGAINLLTLGAPNLDYKFVSGGTCATGTTYAVGDICTVMYTFSPTVPGTRLGGITLTLNNSSGALLGNTFLSGKGIGPRVVFTGNSTLNDLPVLIPSLSGITMDGSGNLFVTDYGDPGNSIHGFVYEVPASSGYTTAIQIGSGFLYPLAAAVDGSGNVFVGDQGNVFEILAAGGYTNTVKVGSGIGQSDGVALDGNGDLYVSDEFNSNVRKFTAASGYTSSTTLGSGFTTPQGMAVDASGNVFVADSAKNAVYEILAAGGYTTVKTLGSGFNLPQAVALDPAGNVFVSDFLNAAIKEILATGGYTTTNTIASNQTGYQLLVDGSGNIFMAGGNLVKLDRSTPPSLTFPTTVDGSSSAAQSVPLANDGNATLAFSSLATTSNFTLSGSSTCPATGTLASGTGCSVSAAFTPQTAGTLTGTLTVTDNALNVANSTQNIALSGQATATKTITFPQPATPVIFGSGATLTATTSNGDPVTYSVLSGTAPITGNTITYNSVGTVIIAANSAATSTYAAAAQVTRTVQVQKATPTVTWPTPGDITFGTALSAAQLNATAALNGTAVEGSFAYNPAAGTVLAPGPHTLNVTFTPMDTTDLTTATGSVTINVTLPNSPAPDTPVGSTSPTETANVTFTTGGVLGAINVLTQGAPNLDFKFVSGGTCASGTAYSAGDVCSVKYSFAPTSPGIRRGGITLTLNISGAVLGQAFLSGTGTGPQVIFPSNTAQVILNQPLTAAYGLAQDGSGNIFVSDAITASILELFAATNYTTSRSLGSGFNSPYSIAVDGVGNLFISDAGTQTGPGHVSEIPAAGGYATTVSVGGSTSFGRPGGVAVDGNGDLYVSDYAALNVLKFTAASNYTSAINVGSGYSSPQGMAIDRDGNVFVADEDAGVIREVTAASNYTTVTTLGAATPVVRGVAFDASGNLFTVGARVMELSAASGYTTSNTLGINGGFNLVIDGNGNLIVAEDALFTMNLATPQPLTFPATLAGSSSIAQTVTFANDGNAGLALSGLTTTPDFTLSGTTCPAIGTLAAGASCTIDVAFTPQTGTTISSNVTITDDALNAAGATQNIAINGQGLLATKTINFPQPASPAALGSTAPLTATASNNDPVSYSVLSGNATVLGSTITYTTVGTVIIAADSAATSTFAAAPQVTRVVQVQKAPTTIAIASSANPSEYGQPVVLTITVSSLFTAAPITGVVTVLADGTTNLGTLPLVNGIVTVNTSLLTAGPHTITASYTGDANFTAITASGFIQTVTRGNTVVTWPQPANFTYGTPLSATQQTATVSTRFFSTVAGTFTYTPAAGTLLTAGTQTLNVLFTPTDTLNFASSGASTFITVAPANPVVIWPTPAGVIAGTVLSGTQLNATAVDNKGVTVPGTFTYTPPAGTVLTAGTQFLSVSFTPTDTLDYTPAGGATSIDVAQVVPTITWPTPADVVAGTVLSGTQLNATATDSKGATIPGVFTYTPPAGTVLATANKSLSLLFTPTDTVDYVSQEAAVSINVIAVNLNGIAPNTALLGDPARTVVLTGTGFLKNSVVLFDGNAMPTTFIDPNTLSVAVPASAFANVHTFQVTVIDPTQNQTSSARTLTVTAPPVTVTLSGPSTVTTGAQPNLNFTLPNSYPVDITGTFTLGFTPSPGLPVDPTALFPNGTTTMSFTIPANTTVTPPVVLQSGSVAGTITVALTLTAGGQTLVPTPPVPPVVIVDPTTVPGVNNVTLTRSGSTLTFAILGFSNIREIDHINFHFIPAAGQTLATSDLTISGADLFGPYYSSAASQQVGSTFEYDQVFNLDQDASVVGQVQVTLVNTLGSSETETAQ